MAKYIEVRRHSLREVLSPTLSNAGRELASEVAASSPRFRFVVSSPLERALETAAAMGFPVGRIDPIWSDQRELPWPGTFSDYFELAHRHRPAYLLAAEFGRAILDVLGRIREEDAALVLTHGVTIPLAAVPWASPASATALGPAPRCMEGVRLTFEGDACKRMEDLRVPSERTRM